MAVWLVGGAVAAIILMPDHSDHSDYSAYSDYDNYSDAAERKRRRIEALKQETESSAKELSDYKRASVNPNLSDQQLKNASAMQVSKTRMDQDAKGAINRKVEETVKSETSRTQEELREIDHLLYRIHQIEEESQS